MISDGTSTYTYDALNHRVRIDGPTTAEYVYHPGGKRASTWDGTPADNLVSSETYLGSTPVAYYTPDAPGSATGSYHWQHQDWLGTERARTNAAGQVEGSYSSLAFGDGYSFTGTDQDASHFTGLDTNPGNGIAANNVHAMFRDYSPTSGNWMSPDPYYGSYNASNPQSMNRYAYVLNNPLSYVDLLGLERDDACDDFDDDGNCFTDGTGDGSRGGGGSWGGGGSDAGGGVDPNNPGRCTDANCVSVSAGPSDPPVDLTPSPIATICFSCYFTSTPPPAAPSNVPVHGPYTYGHFCGAGGMGTPINGTDAACQQHDACYAQAGLSPGSNFTGPNAQLQGCNQQLCNAVRSARQSIINQAAARGTRNSRGVSPVYLPGQESEIEADNEINLYFTYVTGPGGSSCH